MCGGVIITMECSGNAGLSPTVRWVSLDMYHDLIGVHRRVPLPPERHQPLVPQLDVQWVSSPVCPIALLGHPCGDRYVFVAILLAHLLTDMFGHRL